MSSWIFVDLDQFTTKAKTIFVKLSIFPESINSQSFLETDKKEAGDLVFLNGNSDVSRLESLIAKCRDKDFLFLVTNNSELTSQQEGELNRFLMKTSSIRGVIEANQGFGFLISQFNGLKELSDLKFEIETDNEYFEDFESHLNEVTRHLSSQLARVKEIHKQVVPEREITLGKISIKAKFASGENPHREFWDCVKAGNVMVYVLLSTQTSPY